MFGNAAPADRNFDEGIVTQIDLRNKLCKVKTTLGKSLDSVQWTTLGGGSSRGGPRFSPSIGDRVVIMSGLGYPLILGFLPKTQSGDVAFPENIQGGDPTVDVGSFLPLGGEGSASDASSPSDMAAGDYIWTTAGGSMVAALRAGTAILRGSFLAQIIVSKMGDLVKIVSRNFEHFSDVGSVVLRNFKGRVFSYEGYTNSFLDGKLGKYKYRRYTGDVAASEALKEDWLTSGASIPDTSDVIFKEQVYSFETSKETMRRTLKENGSEEYRVSGDSFTVRKYDSESLYLSFNDEHFLKISPTEIKLLHKDGATVVMNASGIVSTFKEGSVNMSEGSVTTAFSDSTVAVSAGSIVAAKGGTTITATSSEASMESGGHFCRVGASGVQLG